jgi:hypothetical protein
MEALQEGPIAGKRNPIVAAEGDKTAATPTTLCRQCSKPFEPRSGSGGKPQRFCSTDCRTAFHGAEPQRAQRSPTCSNVAQLPAVIQPAKKDGSAGTAEDDSSNWCWSVPYQARIECSATNDDEIEIEEISDLDESENVRIVLARSNAVRLARSILYAAGFRSILIATGAKGGYCDVEDGGLPEHFEH